MNLKLKSFPLEGGKGLGTKNNYFENALFDKNQISACAEMTPEVMLVGMIILKDRLN